jgi:hypothetical protein
MIPAGRNNDRQRRRRVGCSKTQFENDMALILVAPAAGSNASARMISTKTLR